MATHKAVHVGSAQAPLILVDVTAEPLPIAPVQLIPTNKIASCTQPVRYITRRGGDDALRGLSGVRAWIEERPLAEACALPDGPDHVSAHRS